MSALLSDSEHFAQRKAGNPSVLPLYAEGFISNYKSHVVVEDSMLDVVLHKMDQSNSLLREPHSTLWGLLKPWIGLVHLDARCAELITQLAVLPGYSGFDEEDCLLNCPRCFRPAVLYRWKGTGKPRVRHPQTNDWLFDCSCFQSYNVVAFREDAVLRMLLDVVVPVPFGAVRRTLQLLDEAEQRVMMHMLLSRDVMILMPETTGESVAISIPNILSNDPAMDVPFAPSMDWKICPICSKDMKEKVKQHLTRTHHREDEQAATDVKTPATTTEKLRDIFAFEEDSTEYTKKYRARYTS
ncbi:uncharacterized protein LOC117647838 [Thrips palmi]|uniref:Uncharacterized protein LOC117647838 n=1 Tax=Thrips palmi TaxID=161013 RepID=A0A6P8Z692_THRPL|nr:uncharacterized protein LOC117647838 [Thrips palmi]